MANKVEENRVRRKAARQRLLLVKSRLRDPDAVGYGGFMLVDSATSTVVAGADPYPYCLNLGEVEAWLVQPKGKR